MLRGEVKSVMANVFDVADFIVDQREETTAWQLQKLCYYCKAWNLAIEGDPFFIEPFEAWKDGPVCRPLYMQHKGARMIPRHHFSSLCTHQISEYQEAMIRSVMYRYRDKTGEELRDMTHSEQPWIEARIGVAEGENSTKKISEETMRVFYSALKDDRRIIEDNMLIFLAEKRLEKSNDRVPFSKILTDSGIDLDMIDDEDIEIEIEPLVLR